MGYEIAGKHILVTGASTGIGAALAEGFAKRGAVVGICARRSDRLGEVLGRLQSVSPSSRSWTVDLSDLDGIAGFARRVSDELGGIDVLVNNAGAPKRRRVTELTPDVVESIMALNYFSPIRLTLALLPELIERQGRVVNIGSIAARLGPPGEAAYAATKAALTAWSESMAVDLAGTGVGVHVVAPAVIDTELFHLPDNDPAMTEGVEALPVDAIVDPVIDLVETGGFERYVPEYFGDIVVGKFQNPQGFMDGTIEFAKQHRS